MQILSSHEARKRFGQVLDDAGKKPVGISRRGRLVAFVVSSEDTQDLLAARRSRDEAQGLARLQASEACADGWNVVADRLGSFAKRRNFLSLRGSGKGLWEEDKDLRHKD